MSIASLMPSNHLILCHPLLLLPSIFPSTRVFSSELVLRIRWPKYWSFSFSISPSNEYSGLISFRTDWLDLLASYKNTASLKGTTSVPGGSPAPRPRAGALPRGPQARGPLLRVLLRKRPHSWGLLCGAGRSPDTGWVSPAPPGKGPDGRGPCADTSVTQLLFN